jgi:hypothetical protein
MMEIEERGHKDESTYRDRPGKGISAVDTPSYHAYNLYRCGKYLIFFDLVGCRGGLRVKGLALW